MANCWRCGGQISSYASRCTWCGRSTTVSGFLQVTAFATLIVAALVVGGVVPVGAFTRFLPTNWLKESPLPPRSTEATEGAGGGGAQGGGARGGYGAVGTQTPEQQRREAARSAAEERARAERAERLAASRPGCDSPERIDALAARHADWDRNDIALIVCRRLREGFSEAQLVAARGRPLRRMTPDSTSGMQVWVYRDIRVLVDGDRIVSIRQQ